MTSSRLLYLAAALLALAGVLMAVSARAILGAVLLVAAAARLFSQKEKENEHTEEKES